LSFWTSQAFFPVAPQKIYLLSSVPLSSLPFISFTTHEKLDLRGLSNNQNGISPEGVLACLAFLTDGLSHLLKPFPAADYFFISGVSPSYERFLPHLCSKNRFPNGRLESVSGPSLGDLSPVERENIRNTLRRSTYESLLEK